MTMAQTNASSLLSGEDSIPTSGGQIAGTPGLTAAEKLLAQSGMLDKYRNSTPKPNCVRILSGMNSRTSQLRESESLRDKLREITSLRRILHRRRCQCLLLPGRKCPRRCLRVKHIVAKITKLEHANKNIFLQLQPLIKSLSKAQFDLSESGCYPQCQMLSWVMTSAQETLRSLKKLKRNIPHYIQSQNIKLRNYQRLPERCLPRRCGYRMCKICRGKRCRKRCGNRICKRCRGRRCLLRRCGNRICRCRGGRCSPFCNNMVRRLKSKRQEIKKLIRELKSQKRNVREQMTSINLWLDEYKEKWSTERCVGTPPAKSE